MQRKHTRSAEISDSTRAWEHGRNQSSTSPLFCGIVTQACEGVVDTAAEGGLIGTQALSRLQTALGQLGYQCKWTPKQTMAKGVGGSAQTIGVILIPLGLGGVVNGVLEATVVEGDIPLLLPVTLLRALHVQLDFSVFTFTMPQHQTTIPMNSMQSGHVTVVVTDFTGGGFNIPEGVGKSSDFQIGQHGNCEVPQMSAQLAKPTNQFASFVSDCARDRHGHAKADESLGASNFVSANGKSNGGAARSIPTSASCQESSSWMACNLGQDRHVAATRGSSGSYARMVLAAACGLGMQQVFGESGDPRGLLLRGDQRGSGAGSF